MCGSRPAPRANRALWVICVRTRTRRVRFFLKPQGPNLVQTSRLGRTRKLTLRRSLCLPGWCPEAFQARVSWKNATRRVRRNRGFGPTRKPRVTKARRLWFLRFDTRPVASPRRVIRSSSLHRAGVHRSNSTHTQHSVKSTPRRHTSRRRFRCWRIFWNTWCSKPRTRNTPNVCLAN